METATRDATEIHSEGKEEKHLGLDKLTLNRPSNRKKEVYHKCGKIGHIQRACRAQQSQGHGRPSPRSRYQKSTHAIETEPDEYGHLLNNLEAHNVNKTSSDVIWIDVKVENQPLSMELDTGSAVSILPYDMFLERFRDKK
ncbi:Retrovirus-related Pol poly from transposon [Paramuricea clavata]|uniref:Retrovirus-related Pol poly from transposon n=1 Tax=Paramuricea clavata TaxID=317549 RepID=A0A7D9DR47_PARCT|nr:Retrovirus-related Pol poly from transposon [Paramuricea clavata]